MEPRLPLARPSNLSAPHLIVWIQKPFLQGCIQRPQLPETQRQQQQKRNIQRRHIYIRFQTQLFPTVPITSSPPPQTELRGPDPADIGHLRGRDSYLWNSLTIDAMSPRKAICLPGILQLSTFSRISVAGRQGKADTHGTWLS